MAWGPDAVNLEIKYRLSGVVLTEINAEEEKESRAPIILKYYLGEMRKWHISKDNESYISLHQILRALNETQQPRRLWAAQHE